MYITAKIDCESNSNFVTDRLTNKANYGSHHLIFMGGGDFLKKKIVRIRLCPKQTPGLITRSKKKARTLMLSLNIKFAEFFFSQNKTFINSCIPFLQNKTFN